MKSKIIFVAFAAVLAATSIHAQNQPAFDSSLTLAANDAVATGGGGTDATQNQGADLAKKLQNPVAALISVPIQNNWDFGIGPADAMKYTANIQPVVPITLNQDYNLIIRTIVPVIDAEAPVAGGPNHSGLGDITQSFFFSPVEPEDGWILGLGPVLYYPTATDSALGAGKWGAGPTFVMLQQSHGWTYGALVNHIWSFAGWGDQTVNSSFLQPFVSYTTKTYTTFGMNTESTYNWQTDQWTVPMNFTVQQLIKIGKLPIAFQVGYRYYAERPAGGPDWGLRFAITFLFPK